MFCKKCGNQLEEGARFCKKCGVSVDTIPSNTQKGITIGLAGKPITIEPVILSVIVLQILQLIFYFIPVFEVSLPSYDESEKYKVINGITESGWSNADMAPITFTIITLSIAAIIFSICNILKIYKFNLIGNIVKFISWGFTSFWVIGTWAVLVQYSQEVQEAYYVQVNMKTTFAGVLYHIINTLLFIMLIVSAIHNDKLKSNI